MKRTKIYFKYFIILNFLLLASICVFKLYESTSQENKSIYGILLKSDCKCRKELISVNKNDENNYLIGIGDRTSYSIKTKDFNSLSLTCDLYSSLRRGPNQKVISFSLFGKDRFYYDFINMNIKIAKKLYPDWTMRVYHDDTIDKDIICEKQCLSDEKNNVYDNIDFCNINQIPHDLVNIWSADYMLPMTWRWLPLGDDFVDVFISRDTDSCILDREVIAVKEWIESTTLFHIMRGKFWLSSALNLIEIWP